MQSRFEEIHLNENIDFLPFRTLFIYPSRLFTKYISRGFFFYSQMFRTPLEKQTNNNLWSKKYNSPCYIKMSYSLDNQDIWLFPFILQQEPQFIFRVIIPNRVKLK